MKPILIALISPSGSTKEIAGILQRAFEKAGRPVEISDLGPGKSLEPYAAVVVAAPIHGMRWMPEAMAYLAAQREGLTARPAALVAVSYLYFEGSTRWKASITKALRTLREALPHASVQVFGGRLPKTLPAPIRWLFGVKKSSPIDLVDPLSITAWADGWVRTVV